MILIFNYYLFYFVGYLLVCILRYIKHKKLTVLISLVEKLSTVMVIFVNKAKILWLYSAIDTKNHGYTIVTIFLPWFFCDFCHIQFGAYVTIIKNIYIYVLINYKIKYNK